MTKQEGHMVLPDTGPPEPYRPEEPLLLTVKQACRQLSCQRTKLFALCAEGHLDRKKLGRATRVTSASVRRLAETGTAARPPSDRGEAA